MCVQIFFLLFIVLTSCVFFLFQNIFEVLVDSLDDISNATIVHVIEVLRTWLHPSVVSSCYTLMFVYTCF